MQFRKLKLFLSLIVLMALSSSAFALQSGDFTYTVSGGTVTITGYICRGGSPANPATVIPATIGDMPVVGIGDYAFYQCFGLTSVTIPDSVTSIGNYAFGYCMSLTRAYFYGNAPSMGEAVFYFCAWNFTVCYTAGSTGFSNPWHSYPTAQCAETTSSTTSIPSTTTPLPTTTTSVQSTTTTITATTSTTIPGGTTTTTIHSGPCVAEAIYGENSEQTELLREYRDTVLSKTPEGQEIIKTYYKFSPTVTRLLEQRPLLKDRAKIFIDGMLPGIRKKVEESDK